MKNLHLLCIPCFLFVSSCDESKTSPPPQEIVQKDEKKETNTAPPPWATRRVPQSGFPCEVEEVLALSCRRCHWEPQENDAPFALRTWDDTQQIRSDKPIATLMEQMVEADLMPPLDALVTPDVEPLSAAHKQQLLEWLKGGAKKREGTGACP